MLLAKAKTGRTLKTRDSLQLVQVFEILRLRHRNRQDAPHFEQGERRQLAPLIHAGEFGRRVGSMTPSRNLTDGIPNCRLNEWQHLIFRDHSQFQQDFAELSALSRPAA